MELVSENVVVTAEQFNPSILSQLWLVKNGILEEGDFAPGCIFADTVAQVRTKDFDLLVIPQRAQFTTSVEPNQKQQLILDKLGTLVSRLPETPYKAVGINLVWHVKPRAESMEELCRHLFFVPSSPVHKFFDVPDGRFGSYLSKNTLGFRLKMTALPAYFEPPGIPGEHVIAFNFNYHYGLPEDTEPVAGISSMLSRWNEAISESSQIVHSVAE